MHHALLVLDDPALNYLCYLNFDKLLKLYTFIGHALFSSIDSIG